jgi:hypothetical protein
MTLPRALALAGGVLLLGVAVVVGRAVLEKRPSDEERIRAVFDEAARAAQEKRADEVVRGVSERFSGEGLDKAGVKRLVAFQLLRGSWVAVAILGSNVEVQGDAARAVADVLTTRGGKVGRITDLLPEQGAIHRLTMTLAREEDAWRVVTASWRQISAEEATAGPRLAPGQ